MMASKADKETKKGHGRLLEAWSPAAGAGEPLGCLATSFTFDPAFFEEDCLGRFLEMETTPLDDGPLYLIEREEKMARILCATALVDQHHCRGARSLRWDLVPARPLTGLLHAKVSLLCWTRCVRVVVASANLTPSGYRLNHEVYGVADFTPEGGEADRSLLRDVTSFLRALVEQCAPPAGDAQGPVRRWLDLLALAETSVAGWDIPDYQTVRSDRVNIFFVPSGPGYDPVPSALSAALRGPRPEEAAVFSPFFDPPGKENRPARELWQVLNQRGPASLTYCIPAQPAQEEGMRVVDAPASLRTTCPSGRPECSVAFEELVDEEGRSFHAKGIRLNNGEWLTYLIGSSNFTSRGLGLHPRASNREANLLYLVNFGGVRSARKIFDACFPASSPLEVENIRFQDQSPPPEDDPAAGAEIPLPAFFRTAELQRDGQEQITVVLAFGEDPPSGWQLLAEEDGRVFYGEEAWKARGRPTQVDRPWSVVRPPSGFHVTWHQAEGKAWLPVNVASAAVLPPPEELKDLPLDVLIDVLTSAQPLHRAIRRYVTRGKKGHAANSDLILDPHGRVDTSRFLLRRTRRVSAALLALHRRLEQPVVTMEGWRWRLHGPVGVMALRNALFKEARDNPDEKSFLLAELLMEISRARPQGVDGAVARDDLAAELDGVRRDLRLDLQESLDQASAPLQRYARRVLEELR